MFIMSSLKSRVPRPPVPHKVKNFWGEFRDFAFQGNMIELAVGIVIGTAFKNLISSLVEHIIMPPIGLVLGNADFSYLYINLSQVEYASLTEAQEAGAPIIEYGMFVTQLIDFMIMALTIYLVLRFVFRYKPEKKV